MHRSHLLAQLLQVGLQLGQIGLRQPLHPPHRWFCCAAPGRRLEILAHPVGLPLQPVRDIMHPGGVQMPDSFPEVLSALRLAFRCASRLAGRAVRLRSPRPVQLPFQLLRLVMATRLAQLVDLSFQPFEPLRSHGSGTALPARDPLAFEGGDALPDLGGLLFATRFLGFAQLPAQSLQFRSGAE